MRKRTFLKMAQYQTQQSQKHLDEVRSIYREMRSYKHDFHHHLMTLRYQLETGEYERALAYIEELDTGLLHIDTMLKTGNVVLDAILSGKLAYAKDREIAVNIKANVPDHLNLSDVELSIIFGNLLDNALQACLALQNSQNFQDPSEEQTSSPFIRIYIGMKGNMLYFSMLNSAGRKKAKVGKVFDTEKTGMHGFGLRQAQKIIEEHDGWCKYNSEDGAFSTEFLIPAISG